MSDTPHIHVLPGDREGRGSRVLEAARPVLERLLPRLAEEALASADDGLYAQAERPGQGVSEADFFNALRALRLERPRISERFTRQVVGALVRLTGGASAAHRAGEAAAELSLVADDHLERQVAVNGLASRVRGRHQRTLRALTLALERHLPRARGGETPQNPIDPAVLGEAFDEALEAIEPAIEPRLVILKIFERTLAARLPTLIEHILSGLGERADQLLAADGERGRLYNRGGGAGHPAAAGAGGEDRTASGGGALAARGGYGIEASSLIALALNMANGEFPAPLPGEGEVLEALSSLSARLAPVPTRAAGEAPRVLDRETVLEELFAALSARGSQAQVDRRVEGMIDVVTQLFEALLADTRLADPIRALIARLQMPVLRQAIADPELFADARHPARMLVNAMAEVATGWVPGRDGERDPLLEALEAATRAVCESEPIDRRSFSAALQIVRDYQDNARRRAAIAAERAAEQERVQAARREAEREAVAQTRSALAGVRLDTDTLERLEAAARRLLTAPLLREGVGGEAFAYAFAPLARVAEAFGDRESAAGRRALIESFAQGILALRRVLGDMHYPVREVDALVQHLEADHRAHLLAQRGEGTVTVEERREPANDDPAGEDTAPVIPKAAEADHLAVPAWIREARLGTWFEVRDRAGNPRRGRLSARLAGGRRYIFVASTGIKVLDLDLGELLAAVEEARIEALSEAALFDTALEAVVSDLRTRRAAAG